MSMISGTVSIDKQRLQNIARRAGVDADRVVGALAQEGKRIVLQSFTEGRPGATYRRGERFHVASAPGSPPRIDTGALAASIRVQAAGRLKRYIVCGVDYAVYLEFGTSDMAARPFMTPMAAKLRENMAYFFRDFIKG